MCNAQRKHQQQFQQIYEHWMKIVTKLIVANIKNAAGVYCFINWLIVFSSVSFDVFLCTEF